MSEYQYYEFRAIDQPLSERARQELRELSSRAEITPTSFTNTYHYGDFRGRPDKLMESYFDAFVYVAKWGTHRLVFRLPGGLIDTEEAAAYEVLERLTIREAGEHVVVDITANLEEGGYWEDGEGSLDALLPVRSELMSGDLRALYLGWLAALHYGGDDGALEPPVPPGLGELSTALEKLAEFLWIEPDLVEVAAAGAAEGPPTGPSSAELAAWVHKLPGAEKDDLLRRVAEDNLALVRAELLRRFRQAWRAGRPRAPAAAGPRRTFRQLLAAAEGRAEEERRRAEEEAAQARAEQLGALAAREGEVWREVEALIQTKKPKEYTRAVGLLKELRDLGERQGRQADMAARIRELRQRYANRSGLKRLLNEAGLTG
jgi:hypothetical protein